MLVGMALEDGTVYEVGPTLDCPSDSWRLITRRSRCQAGFRKVPAICRYEAKAAPVDTGSRTFDREANRNNCADRRRQGLREPYRHDRVVEIDAKRATVVCL
jgi:hypothetical protein